MRGRTVGSTKRRLEIIRTIVGVLAILALLPARHAQAQTDWPNKPLRISVAFAAGSFTDVAARSVGRELTEQLGQQVIVENRLGAGGTLGTNAAAKATPRRLVSRLNLEMARALGKPRLKELFVSQGAVAVASSASDLSGRVDEEIKTWSNVITKNGVKVE